MQDLVPTPSISVSAGAVVGGTATFGPGYGYDTYGGNSTSNTSINFESGAIGVHGISDPNAAAKATVDEIATRVGL